MYDPSQSLELHQLEGGLVKSSIMDEIKSSKSHLAPPGSKLKRSREDGASELDPEFEKKLKTASCLKPKLMKSKSKSMMNINKKSQVSKVDFEVSNVKVKVPLPNMEGTQRRQTSNCLLSETLVLPLKTNVSDIG